VELEAAAMASVSLTLTAGPHSGLKVGPHVTVHGLVGIAAETNGMRARHSSPNVCEVQHGSTQWYPLHFGGAAYVSAAIASSFHP